MRGNAGNSCMSRDYSEVETAFVETLVADDHLLCNATVQTPNKNLFLACTMIDSGSQSSLVSEEFILRHQLTSTPLRPVIPI